MWQIVSAKEVNGQGMVLREAHGRGKLRLTDVGSGSFMETGEAFRRETFPTSALEESLRVC